MLFAAEDDWYPYSGVRDGQAVGLTIDIMRAIYQQKGVVVRFQPLSYSRCMEVARTARYAGCFTTSRNDFYEPYYRYAQLPLLDAANLQEKDAEWENKWRARLGKAFVEPLYTVADTEQTLKQRRPLAYGQTQEVAPGVRITYHDAGHILGSAIVDLHIIDHHLDRHLVFSGDLGNACSPLMRDPSILTDADLVLMESTYGDRDHRNDEETLEELAAILQAAHRDGGNVLIPSFAVGRTQDLIYYLGRFYQEGRLPQQAVFLDSPMAIRANAIYSRYHEQFDAADRERLQAKGVKRIEDWLPVLRCTPSPEESMAINRIKSGAIIIAGSGMCTGGRIVHHFKHNLWRRECHLVFPGFCSGQHPHYSGWIFSKTREITKKEFVIAQAIGGHESVGHAPARIGNHREVFNT